MEDYRARINPTAVESYKHQGPGCGDQGRGIEYLDEKSGEDIPKLVPLINGAVCLDVGFGMCETIEKLILDYRCRLAYGVDIAEACSDSPVVKRLDPHKKCLWILDVSHTVLPIQDNAVDIAFCTETIEHLSNPFYMFAEVKRVLKHGSLFVLSFPRPEDNLGYGGGEHAHIYPGFLRKEYFAHFCKQMYFKELFRLENGSSGWYILKNFKAEGVTDVFEMASGNYSEERLFKCMEDF